MLRSRNKAMGMTSQTTISAGSFRRRIDTVPVAVRASSTHCGSIASVTARKPVEGVKSPNESMDCVNVMWRRCHTPQIESSVAR